MTSDRTPWWEQRLASLDLETTDKNPLAARIVTASFAEFGGGMATSRAEWLADPGIPIPDGAARIHGITTEVAREKGRPREQVLEELLHVLAARPPGSPLIVMNARYDLTVIDREARRLGLGELWESILPGLLIVDPFIIDGWLDQFRRGLRTLGALSKHYRCELSPEEAHMSAADALQAAVLARVLVKYAVPVREVRTWKGKAIEERDRLELESLKTQWEGIRFDLANLHDAQKRWHRARQESRQDYYYRRNDPRANEVILDDFPCAPWTGVLEHA